MANDDKALTNSEIIDIWKKVIDVQQHFNDVEMRVRSSFITLAIALFAAMGFLIDKRLSVDFGSWKVLYVVVIPLVGILLTRLFYFVDRHWYHRLLLGAVDQGIFIENRHKELMPELALSEAIGKKSPVLLATRFGRFVAWMTVNDERYKKDGKIHSDAKIDVFYNSVEYLFWLVFLGFVFLFVLWNDEPLSKVVVDYVRSLC